MKSAMVVGGYSHHVRGAWADALRGVGVEVACCYTADQDFRGLPHKVPKGIDVVLVVAGSCSHKASERAKSAAQAAGLRCETVSKDAARTVQWLTERGYAPDPVQAEKPETKQEKQMPIVYKPAAPEVAQEPAPSPAPDPDVTEWLDRKQIRELLPDLSDSTFYDLVKQVVKRPVRKERRLVRDNPVRHHMVMVWTMDEVSEIERMAKAHVPRYAPKPVFIPVADSPVSDPPVTFEQVFGRPVNLKPVELPPTENLDWLIKSLHRMTEELAEAAVRERNEWKAKCEAVEAERDALKAQLERIKSALGV